MTTHELLLDNAFTTRQNVILANGVPGLTTVAKILQHAQRWILDANAIKIDRFDTFDWLQFSDLQAQVLIFDGMEKADNAMVRTVGEIVAYRSFNGEALPNLVSVVLIFNGEFTLTALTMAAMAPSVTIAIPNVTSSIS